MHEYSDVPEAKVVCKKVVWNPEEIFPPPVGDIGRLDRIEWDKCPSLGSILFAKNNKIETRTLEEIEPLTTVATTNIKHNPMFTRIIKTSH